MQILFVNHTFPGDFGALAASFAADAGNKVLFMSSYGRREFSLPGVRRVVLKINHKHVQSLTPLPGPDLNRDYTTARQSFVAYANLLRTGFVPDMVLSTAKRGYALFLHEAFPETFLVGYADANLTVEKTQTCLSSVGLVRQLLQSQHLLRSHIYCIGTGQEVDFFPSFDRSCLLPAPYCVDTDFFSKLHAHHWQPAEKTLSLNAELISLRVSSLTILEAGEFVNSLLLVLQRSNCHLVLIYSGLELKEALTNFILTLPVQIAHKIYLQKLGERERYRDLLCTSSVHIFPDRIQPNVIEVLEAMSCANVILTPSSEILQHILCANQNAIINSCSTREEWTNFLLSLLAHKEQLHKIREAARSTVCKNYKEQDVLSRHIALLRERYEQWKKRMDKHNEKSLLCFGNGTHSMLNTTLYGAGQS